MRARTYYTRIVILTRVATNRCCRRRRRRLSRESTVERSQQQHSSGFFGNRKNVTFRTGVRVIGSARTDPRVVSGIKQGAFKWKQTLLSCYLRLLHGNCDAKEVTRSDVAAAAAAVCCVAVGYGSGPGRTCVVYGRETGRPGPAEKGC